MKTAVAACLAVSIFYASDCVAASGEALPTDVRPLTREEVVKIYSGKTISYTGFSYYFGPDGYLVGVTTNHLSSGKGRWVADDNAICLHSTWQAGSASKSFDVCYAWYVDDAAYWTKITKGQLSGNVYKGDSSRVTAGDHVSELVAAASRGRLRASLSQVMWRRAPRHHHVHYVQR
jgi:hypothetical protein